jgi:nitronate monooxygenase
VLLSGSIAHGRSVLAAQTAGADLAYIGSAFIATEEANADQRYKQMIVDSTASDIVYSNLFTGVHGNYLRGSIESAGLDPNNLAQSDPSAMNFNMSSSSEAKAWRDIWGAGQGVGAVTEVLPAAVLIDKFVDEYRQAGARLAVLGSVASER